MKLNKGREQGLEEQGAADGPGFPRHHCTAAGGSTGGRGGEPSPMSIPVVPRQPGAGEGNGKDWGRIRGVSVLPPGSCSSWPGQDAAASGSSMMCSCCLGAEHILPPSQAVCGWELLGEVLGVERCGIGGTALIPRGGSSQRGSAPAKEPSWCWLKARR